MRKANKSRKKRKWKDRSRWIPPAEGIDAPTVAPPGQDSESHRKDVVWAEELRRLLERDRIMEEVASPVLVEPFVPSPQAREYMREIRRFGGRGLGE